MRPAATSTRASSGSGGSTTMTDFEQKLVASAAGPLASSYPPDISAALEQSGHADVVYMVEDSPVGRLLLAASDRGLVCLHFVRDDAGLERSLEAIASKLTPRIVAG